MYESLRSVYFPTNVIVTESNSLSWLMMMKGISDWLSIAKERERAHPSVISFHRFTRPFPFISSKMEVRSWMPNTCSCATRQHMDILSFVAKLSGWGIK